MFGQFSPARRQRSRRRIVPVIGAALLVGLLPTQALAIPPTPAAVESGRETLDLEPLDRDQPVSGQVFDKNLASLKVDVPDDLEQAAPGTTTAPAGDSGAVNFGTGVTPASTRAAASAAAAPVPVEDLPVSLGQAPDQPAPTGIWQATVFARTAAVSQGVDGAVVKVTAPSSGAVPISVKLDYTKFKNLYGADWASRLRFVQFPECYLTTPDDEACQAYEELETANDTSGESITATVDPAADGTVTPASTTGSTARQSGATTAQAAYRNAIPAAATGDTAVLGAMDSGAGAGGSFKATPLASDGKWEAGGSSGAFNWSYPLTVPIAPAGPAPIISLDYSSQGVDGRTAVSSPQSSWIGEGWDYEPGHIERRYRTCEDDRKDQSAGAPNNKAKADKTSDLCWVSYNAVMSLAGKTTELVRDAVSGSNPETDTEIYRPQQDDGTRIEHRVGGSNGDNNGEYWVVITTDGTKHYYGLNQVGGGHADTDSVSTVPVFGNHPGEPCHASAFADSRCGAGKKQAWRWGLDKVVDVHGNAMVVDWHQSTNYYSVKEKFKTPESYDRAAYPDYIEYGMRSSDLTKPSAKVDFVAAQRCLASSTICDGANFDKTDDPGAYRPWWDSPGNLNCKSTSDLCPSFPSFWTRLRLSAITMYGQRPGSSALQKVDTYTLHQSFPEDWYDTSPGLWLNSITRTGYGPGDTTGTLQSKDGVSFAQYTVGSTSPLRARLKDRQLPNLVSSGPNDQRPGFTRPRIGTVATESGGDVEVEYTGGCATEPSDDKGKNNTTCYPVRWSPDGDEKTPAKAWFNKYVVDSVTETDKVTSHGRPVYTKYRYSDPAWAKSDDEFTRPSLRTYSDWRGYRDVSTTKGSKSSSQQGDPQSQSYSRSRYFQGIGGEVKDSTGTYSLAADDAPQYAGMTAESISYANSDGRIVKRTLNYPWSKQTASRTRENEDGSSLDPLLAHSTGVKRSDVIQTVDTSWQAVRTTTTSDATYGLPTQVETAVVKPDGTGESLSEQTCTKLTYVHNTTDWLIGLPIEQKTTATPCSGYASADPATELKGSVRTTYDGLAYGATPTKGLATSVAETNAAGTSHSIVTRTTYDPLGRVRTVTKPNAGTSEIQYTPGDTGGPVTSTKTINALGHATTTAFDAGRGLPLTVTDPNGRETRREYDALGRLVKGWSASRSSGGKSADVEIDYQAAIATSDETRPAAVTVKTLKDDGSYSRQVTIYDGLGRQVQTQTEAHGPGRIIADTTYNDHGLVDQQTGGYLAKDEPATELFQPKSTSLIPSWTKTRYDGLERQVRLSTYLGGDYKYATYTSYTDTSTYVDPPGSTAPSTKTFTDALGRVTSIRHYTKTDASAWRTTSYAYDARGNQNKVTDPAGNTWTYTYDARGRVTSATDPDTGTTQTEYDDADRPTHTTNSLNKSMFTDYDVLGRVKAVREGTATASPTREYFFDTLPGALGQPVSSIRHAASGDYIDRVTGYDTEYRPTGRETVIPANSMTTGLSGTYAYSYSYTPTGKPLSVTLPAKGGLASEKVITRYDEDGLPESTSGQSWYTADATYSPYGEVQRTVTGSQPSRLWTTNFVDPHTGRLQRTVTDRETSAPHRITDSYYAYNTSGSITSSARKLSEPSGSTWDNQCFSYDALGELVNSWTSGTVPDGTGTGCKSASGATWGYRTDFAPSSGPVADAPNEITDTTSPDTSLTASLAATAPDAATVATGATAYRQSYTFDWLGNRANMTEHNPADASKNVSYTYSYGTTVTGNGTFQPYTAQPHTLTQTSSTPSGKGGAYSYDAAGNTQVRDLASTTQNLIWTAENKLDTITDDGTKTTYVYDTAGNRILENSPSGSTLYLGETELTTDATGKITRATRAYSQAGAPTVIRSTDDGASTGHKLNALVGDQVGTANTTVELSGTQPVTRRAFKPYGEARGSKPASWPNKRSYLGVGIDDAATGLTHIGAREYDQNSGRFLSADPVIDIADPLQMNGYSYSSNSPVSMSDPTGLKAACGPGFDVPCGKTDHNGDGAPDNSSHNWINSSGGGSTAREIQAATHTIFDVAVDQYTRGRPNTRNPSNTSEAEFAEATRLYQSPSAGVDDEAAMELWYYGASKEEITYFLGHYCEFLRCNGPIRAGLTGHPVESPFTDTGMQDTLTASLGAGAMYRGAATGKTNCFPAGTSVLMAGGKTKNIEKIKTGDTVIATDPKTGETGARKVTQVIVTDGDKFFNSLSIATENGIEELVATREHPFWSPSERKWVAADELKQGMTLLTDDGSTAIVVANRNFAKHERTYNLTVEDLHTYYVLAGATPVLVHNTCGPTFRTGKPISGPLPDAGQTSLYALIHPRTGKLLKWGISKNPVGRYSGPEYENGTQMRILRNYDSRQDALDVERYMTERHPGPLNLEPHRGSVSPTQSWEKDLQYVTGGRFFADRDGG
ncbi:polymorphic toxin-type HINT domain-containing protein [Streptomyces sp. NPDC005507]|uniref:polymorphic toxin-type HINT domain-containing protein n=1 Tax=Streptomyces sp. NPDC005507 TaxID=3154885 RepID=UPI0033A3FD35